MKWEKVKLLYCPNGEFSWAQHTALQPTPLLLHDRVRIYVGFRDQKGISRIGYVDIDRRDPSSVLEVSSTPALDIGPPGSFDENGVVPSAVVQRDNRIFLYYAGYQLGHNVRFSVFCGLAISEDGGKTFTRYRCVPVLDRTDDELLFRVIHSIHYEDKRWKIWYGAGSSFKQGKSKTLPVYNVRYAESIDGIHFPNKGKIVLDVSGDEHRIGRPYVIKKANQYFMFYGYGTEDNPYTLGYASSLDGIHWQRHDRDVGITLSKSGWDSQMMAYPAYIQLDNSTILLYNGNNMGREGIGYAILKEDF